MHLTTTVTRKRNSSNRAIACFIRALHMQHLIKICWQTEQLHAFTQTLHMQRLIKIWVQTEQLHAFLPTLQMQRLIKIWVQTEQLHAFLPTVHMQRFINIWVQTEQLHTHTNEVTPTEQQHRFPCISGFDVFVRHFACYSGLARRQRSFYDRVERYDQSGHAR